MKENNELNNNISNKVHLLNTHYPKFLKRLEAVHLLKRIDL